LNEQKVTTMSKSGNKASLWLINISLALGDVISNIGSWLKVQRDHRICTRPLNIWRNARGVFKRPKLVFTYGNRIHNSQRYCYYVPTWSIHMPGAKYNYKERGYVFTPKASSIYKTLHLSWLKPYYDLPYWFYLGFYRQDAGWKSKYREYRYEDTPPLIELSFFKWSLCWSWHAPIDTGTDKYDLTQDIHYWESLMEYIWGNHQKEGPSKIEATALFCGKWSASIGDNKASYWQLNPEYLEQPYADEIIDFEYKEDVKKGGNHEE